MCPGSLKMVACTGFGRVILCPQCGRKLKPLRRTMDGRRAQIRAHPAPASEERPSAEKAMVRTR